MEEVLRTLLLPRCQRKPSEEQVPGQLSPLGPHACVLASPFLSQYLSYKGTVAHPARVSGLVRRDLNAHT